MNTDKLKEKIKERLKTYHISIGMLCKLLGRNRKFFAEIKTMSVDRLYLISSVTGVSVYDFLEDERFKKYYDEKGELTRIERI